MYNRADIEQKIKLFQNIVSKIQGYRNLNLFYSRKEIPVYSNARLSKLLHPCALYPLDKLLHGGKERKCIHVHFFLLLSLRLFLIVSFPCNTNPFSHPPMQPPIYSPVYSTVTYLLTTLFPSPIPLPSFLHPSLPPFLFTSIFAFLPYSFFLFISFLSLFIHPIHPVIIPPSFPSIPFFISSPSYAFLSFFFLTPFFQRFHPMTFLILGFSYNTVI